MLCTLMSNKIKQYWKKKTGDTFNILNINEHKDSVVQKSYNPQLVQNKIFYLNIRMKYHTLSSTSGVNQNLNLDSNFQVLWSTRLLHNTVQQDVWKN